MPVWWTKRSLPPSSGVTKPKPFSSLNHFTVPVAMVFLYPSRDVRALANARGCYGATTAGAGHFFTGLCTRPCRGERSSFGSEKLEDGMVVDDAGQRRRLGEMLRRVDADPRLQ